MFIIRGWSAVLILTRKPGEKLIINDDITITILEFKGNQVRVGIDAPCDVSVFREEIYQKIVNKDLDKNLGKA